MYLAQFITQAAVAVERRLEQEQFKEQVDMVAALLLLHHPQIMQQLTQAVAVEQLATQALLVMVVQVL